MFSISDDTMGQLMGARFDPREIRSDEAIILLRLRCPKSGVRFHVFGAVGRPEGNDITLVGHVTGGKYRNVFIHHSLREIREGNWFGGEVPTADPDLQPDQWKNIKKRFLR